MAGGWILGLGISIVFFFARYVFPAMSRFVSGTGVAIGLLVVANELVDKSMKAPFGVVSLVAIAIACMVGAVYLYVNRPMDVSSVLPPPTIVPTPAAPPVVRVPSTKTIRQLKQLYEGRTALQAAPFMADEVNKWIETDGKILRVDDGMALLLNGDDHIECRFDQSWNAKLASFRDGEIMKVFGRINPQQNGAQIYLLECEVR